MNLLLAAAHREFKPKVPVAIVEHGYPSTVAVVEYDSYGTRRAAENPYVWGGSYLRPRRLEYTCVDDGYCTVCWWTWREKWREGSCRCGGHCGDDRKKDRKPTSASDCDKCKEITGLPSTFVPTDIGPSTEAIQVAVTGNLGSDADALERALMAAGKFVLDDRPRDMDRSEVVPYYTMQRQVVDSASMAIPHGTTCPYQKERSQAMNLRNAASRLFKERHPELAALGFDIYHVLKEGGDWYYPCSLGHPGAVNRSFTGQLHVAAYCIAAMRNSAPENTVYVQERDEDRTIDAIMDHVRKSMTVPGLAQYCVVVGPAILHRERLNAICAAVNPQLVPFGLTVYVDDASPRLCFWVIPEAKIIGGYRDLRNLPATTRDDWEHVHDHIAIGRWLPRRLTYLWCELMTGALGIEFTISDMDRLAYRRV
jgi:hypothetical protein